MKIRDFILSLVSWFILLVTVSCSDELGGERAPISSESNLHVLVPTVLSSRGTRTDDASGLPTYNATVDECQINDLTLYAFPVDGNGKLLKETLPAPLATMMVEPNVANYQLNIEPGTYHIYVVANMNKVLSGQTIKTEDDLKKIVLGYGVGTVPGMPVSTNIPMIYEPKDVNGTIINTKIEKSGKKYTEVAANLKFTCVKVKLNLIMDPTASDNLYDKSYSITDIVAQKLTPSTHLLWDGKFTQSNVTSEYAKGIDTPLYNSTPTGDACKGCYYQKDEYEIIEANKDVANEDVVKIADAYKDKGTVPPTNFKQWLFQGTYYLPERYISKAEEQSVLKINGIVNSSNKNQYTIKLGHKQNASDLPTFPRGTYYEITGKLKSYGDMDLDCDVKVSDWKPVEINVDFYHTTLWVNKAKAEVSSTKSDTISYKSSETVVDFGCIDTKTVGETNQDIIVVTKKDDKNIIFGINPEIPIDQFEKDKTTGKREGTATVYLQANNIKKYIEVHYDVTPYFKVSPKNVVIYWGKDPDDKQVLEKHFVVETNLGGLKAYQNINGTLTEKASGSTVQVGEAPSRLEISYDNTPNADGKYLMKVTETVDPQTTTVYNFTLSPKNPISGDEDRSQEVTVTVKPEFGPYRIYMRAINNICNWDGKESGTANLGVIFAEQKTEYTGINGSYNDKYNFNWYDGWTDKDVSKDENNDDNKHIQDGRHKMYMYTQLGENTSGSTTVKDDAYVWIFSEKFPGDQMTGDVNNAGWYYKDMEFNAYSKYAENKATGTKKQIKPGQTLVIFGTGENVGNGVTGCTPHRFPHTMDPGIPLFNYEDREGWYLYDPTCIPYYRVYDDKPTIINVDYVIYTKSDITKWKIDFGKKNNKFDSYTLECNSDKFKQKSEEVGNGWYRTVLSFKAPKGEYEKAIMVSISGNNDQMLFGGDSYPCIYDAATKQYQIFGYYDGSWHDGKPLGVSK
uniref:fimbrial protein n=2 Tax=Prevotellaceae TaxID=171552 RepID=UPI0025907E4B